MSLPPPPPPPPDHDDDDVPPPPPSAPPPLLEDEDDDIAPPPPPGAPPPLLSSRRGSEDVPPPPGAPPPLPSSPSKKRRDGKGRGQLPTPPKQSKGRDNFKPPPIPPPESLSRTPSPPPTPPPPIIVVPPVLPNALLFDRETFKDEKREKVVPETLRNASASIRKDWRAEVHSMEEEYLKMSEMNIKRAQSMGNEYDKQMETLVKNRDEKRRKEQRELLKQRMFIPMAGDYVQCNPIGGSFLHAQIIDICGKITSQYVRELVLDNCGVTDANMCTMAFAIAQSRCLHSISLKGNQLTHEGVSSLAHAIHSNNAVRDRISSIWLNRNKIGDRGVASFIPLIKAHKRKDALMIDFSECGIADGGARLLAGSLTPSRVNAPVYDSPNFPFLRLSGNAIGPAGLALLVDAIRANSNITSLDVSANRKLGDFAAITLAKVLEESNNIAELNISDMGIGTEAMARFFDAAKENGSLCTLLVGGNEKASDLLDLGAMSSDYFIQDLAIKSTRATTKRPVMSSEVLGLEWDNTQQSATYDSISRLSPTASRMSPPRVKEEVLLLSNF